MRIILRLFGLMLTATASGGDTYRNPLTSATGLKLESVAAEPASLEGKRGIKVVMREDVLARLQAMDAPARQRAAQAGELPVQLAVIEGLEFGDGTIDLELAGEPMKGAAEGARGFVGVAFHLQKDLRTYNAFYLRPTNGRADDQLRRNHSAQYISQPQWPWFKLREETPGKYESYVDLVPGAWTKVKIEVKGEKARLYVHGVSEPTLIVNDLKTGAGSRGGVALWLDVGTLAHFRNLIVTPSQ